MDWRVVETDETLTQRTIARTRARTERGVLLAWIAAADKRYGVGKWRTRPGDARLFGGVIVAPDGRCLTVEPA